MKKTIEEIKTVVRQLPRPLVGGLCYRHNDAMEIRDSCIDMFNEVFDIVKPHEILEIGTHAGGSSCLMLSLSDANITSVDIGHNWIEWDYGFYDWNVRYENTNGLKQVVEVLQSNFGKSRFRFIMGDSQLEETINKFNDRKYDLSFIDGDHSYEAFLKDFQTAIRLKIPYVLVDDYNIKTGRGDERIAACEDHGWNPIKVFENIHNAADIGCALFKL